MASEVEIDTDEIGQLGVNLVENVVLGVLHWAFRPQLISDQGIDAQVEVKDGPRTTGRLLALQIKGGDSWFRENATDGWVFRFNSRKAKLWLGHALPVVVVLVDLTGQRAFWQRVSPETVTKAGDGYKVIVPRAQSLGLETLPVWEQIASGLELRAVEGYESALQYLPGDVQWLLNEMHAASPPDAAVLALHLAEGRGNPAAVMQSILTAEPHWIRGASGIGWRVAGAYALNHELRVEAAAAFEKAAEVCSVDSGRRLASAALALLPVDAARSRALLASADKQGAPKHLIIIARCLLEHPIDDAHPFDLDTSTLETVEADSDPLTHSFLAEHHARNGAWSEAVLHARRSIELAREKTAPQLRAAHWMIVSSIGLAGPTDYKGAERLLTSAIEQRLSWGGATSDGLHDLLGVLAMQGNFEGVLRHSSPPPWGSAAVETASEPRVLRHAIQAAHLLGLRDLVATFAVGLTADDPEAQLLRSRVGLTETSPAEQVSLLVSALNLAKQNGEYERMVQTIVQLAQSGVDRSVDLSSLSNSGIIRESMVEFISALAAASRDLDAGLPRLRSIAVQDQNAAESVIDLLNRADRNVEAANMASLYNDTFRQPYFLLLKAQSLIDGKVFDHAERASVEALAAVTEGFSFSRGRLHTFLAARCAGRGVWSQAEQHIELTIGLLPQPRENDYWRLVTARLAQGDPARAAEVVRAQDLRPRLLEEAHSWLQCMATQEWTDRIATDAVSIATQFEAADPQLAAALLTRVIYATRTAGSEAEAVDEPAGLGEQSPVLDRRPLVPAGVHQAALAALDSLLDEHGEDTGVVRIRGEEQELVEQITRIAKEGASEPFVQLDKMIRDGRVPVGCVTMIGRCYASTILDRSAGPQQAAAVDDETNDADVCDAQDSLGLAVVVEASTLAVLSQIAGGAELIGYFSQLGITASSKLDLARAMVDVRGRTASGASLYWDNHSDGLIIDQITNEDYLDLRRRADHLDAFSARATVMPTGGTDLFPGIERDAAPWLAAVELAAERGIALWSDDVALRGLARAVGVKTFGTPALCESLSNAALALDDPVNLSRSLQTRAGQVREFVRCYVVDVPANLKDLLAQAELDEWEARAAAVLLTRPSWWAWQLSPLADWWEIASEVLANNDRSILLWARAAMEGVCRSYGSDAAASMLCAVALVPHLIEPEADVLRNMFSLSSRFAVEYQLGDPIQQLPIAVRALVQLGHVEESEQLMRDVERAVSSVGDER